MQHQTVNGTNLVQGIDTIILRVSNLESSREWFNKMGLLPVFEDPQMKLAVLNTNGATTLTLWQTDDKVSINRNTASFPIFKTCDANSLRKELISRGIEPGEIREDEYVKYFQFSDPDGNILEACQVK